MNDGWRQTNTSQSKSTTGFIFKQKCNIMYEPQTFPHHSHTRRKIAPPLPPPPFAQRNGKRPPPHRHSSPHLFLLYGLNPQFLALAILREKIPLYLRALRYNGDAIKKGGEIPFNYIGFSFVWVIEPANGAGEGVHGPSLLRRGFGARGEKGGRGGNGWGRGGIAAPPPQKKKKQGQLTDCQRFP